MLEASALTGQEDIELSDPRESVSLEGIGYQALTYLHDDTIVYDKDVVGGSAQVGLAVTIESAGTVSLVGDAEQVEGRLIKVEPGGVAVVQVHGHMELPGGTSAGLTIGKAIVGDLLVSAEGYIREVGASDAELAVARGTIKDPTTTTAVVVEL